MIIIILSSVTAALVVVVAIFYQEYVPRIPFMSFISSSPEEKLITKAVSPNSSDTKELVIAPIQRMLSKTPSIAKHENLKKIKKDKKKTFRSAPAVQPRMKPLYTIKTAHINNAGHVYRYPLEIKGKAPLEPPTMSPYILCFSVIFILLIALFLFKRYTRVFSRKTQKKVTQEQADEEPAKTFRKRGQLHVVNTKPRLSRKARKRLRRTDEKTKVTQLPPINSSRDDDQCGRENILGFIKDIGEKDVFVVNEFKPTQKQRKRKEIKVTNSTTIDAVKKTVSSKPKEEKKKTTLTRHNCSQESNYNRSRKPRRRPFTLRDFIPPFDPTNT